MSAPSGRPDPAPPLAEFVRHPRSAFMMVTTYDNFHRRVGGARVKPLLDGVRVVDLSRVLAGPFAGRVFVEMGARVVKVEYGRGDPAHEIGPHRGARSLYYSSLNSGKELMSLDLRRPEDRHALEGLLADCDVLLNNQRPSVAAALGLDPARLLERHPQLIVTTIGGYAMSGDRSEEGAFDLTMQAEAGIMSVTGERGRPPARAGVPISDLTAGMWAVAGTLGALFARERDGFGRHIEIPMLDATLSLLSYVGTTALATGVDPEPVGAGHHNAGPYGAYEARDGWIVIAALSDKLWRGLCDALDLPELAARDDLATNRGRARALHEIDSAVAAKVGGLTREQAMDALRGAGVPHAPVNSVIEALTAPYVRTRGTVQTIDAPEGSYDVVTSPLIEEGVRLSPAPALGRPPSGAVTRTADD